VARWGTVSGLARALGVHRTQACAWRRSGVPLDTADRIAVALGLHPAEVWTEWHSLGLEGAEAA
jgi:plasmid maintenance system antidote protein VapI